MKQFQEKQPLHVYVFFFAARPATELPSAMQEKRCKCEAVKEANAKKDVISLSFFFEDKPNPNKLDECLLGPKCNI